jgi:DNA recombination protein RmuC
MPNPLSGIILALLLFTAVCQVVLLRRRSSTSSSDADVRLDALDRSLEKTERTIREQLGQNRDEGIGQARSLREELQGAVQTLACSLRESIMAIGGGHKDQLDGFARELAEWRRAGDDRLSQFRQNLDERLQGFSESLTKLVSDLSQADRRQSEALSAELGTFRDGHEKRQEATRIELINSLRAFSETVVKSMSEMGTAQTSQLGGLTEAMEQRLENVRSAVDERLKALQTENSEKLEQMRRTVDEQLQGTLEKRLGESFQLVSDRLEQVHRGLGEMQTLATGVGDLKKVLSNVRARGAWGEIQLGALLEDSLHPDQYGRNVATTGGGERVEFAIRLPGPDPDSHIWLPIDAKFPQEDYLRLVEAAERGDAAEVELCGKHLEQCIRTSARDIRLKYIAPPATTDFAVMYMPTEGLFAEVLRRPGLVESLQREYRVSVAGPTTLAALLNSLQMGFRTLAIQKRSSEVWGLLASVKTEFGKYGGILQKVQKKLQEATNTVDQGLRRTRVIERRLKHVEAPSTQEESIAVPELDMGVELEELSILNVQGATV